MAGVGGCGGVAPPQEFIHGAVQAVSLVVQLSGEAAFASRQELAVPAGGLRQPHFEPNVRIGGRLADALHPAEWRKVRDRDGVRDPDRAGRDERGFDDGRAVVEGPSCQRRTLPRLPGSRRLPFRVLCRDSNDTREDHRAHKERRRLQHHGALRSAATPRRQSTRIPKMRWPIRMSIVVQAARARSLFQRGRPVPDDRDGPSASPV